MALFLALVTRECHTKCPLYVCAKHMALVSIRPRLGKGPCTPRTHSTPSMHSTPRMHTYLQGPPQLAPPHSPAQSRSWSQSQSSDSHLMAWFSFSGAQNPKHRLPMWPPGSSSDELTGTPGTRRLSLAVGMQPGGRGRRRKRRTEMRQSFGRLYSPALLPLSAHRPPSPPTEHSPSPGHWALFSSCCPESRRQTGSHQHWGREGGAMPWAPETPNSFPVRDHPAITGHRAEGGAYIRF